MSEFQQEWSESDLETRKLYKLFWSLDSNGDMYTGKAITSLCLWFLWLFVFTAGMLVVDFLIIRLMAVPRPFLYAFLQQWKLHLITLLGWKISPLRSMLETPSQYCHAHLLQRHWTGVRRDTCQHWDKNCNCGLIITVSGNFPSPLSVLYQSNPLFTPALRWEEISSASDQDYRSLISRFYKIYCTVSFAFLPNDGSAHAWWTHPDIRIRFFPKGVLWHQQVVRRAITMLYWGLNYLYLTFTSTILPN